MSEPASFGRGTDITRVTSPFPSMTSMDSDDGSTKSVESPLYVIRPAARELYALAVALVVSATTENAASDGSNNTIFRPRLSLTSTLPLGSARTCDTAPRYSADVAVILPSGLMGGSADAGAGVGSCAASVFAASAVAASAMPVRALERAR